MFFYTKLITVGRRKGLMNRKDKRMIVGLLCLFIMTFCIIYLHTQSGNHDLEIESKYMPSESKLQAGMLRQFYHVLPFINFKQKFKCIF